MIVVQNRHLDANLINFFSILEINICIMLLIFLSNFGVKKCEYSRIILSYFYLKTKIKKNDDQKNIVTWIKWLGIPLISIILVALILNALNRWLVIFNNYKSNLYIFAFVLIVLCIYVPNTEFIFDEIQYYKVQKIASEILFIAMFFAYIYSSGNISEGDTSKMLSILIFAIGQIVFIVTVISSDKNMYKILKEKNKVELELYLQKIDRDYIHKVEQINDGVIEAKRITEEFKDQWKEIPVKQRRRLVKIISGGFLLGILLILLVIRIINLSLILV